jgi:hypothetical protein
VTRAERQAWVTSKAYQRRVAEAREIGLKDPDHRKVVERVRATIRRAREVMAEGPDSAGGEGPRLPPSS